LRANQATIDCLRLALEDNGTQLILEIYGAQAASGEIRHHHQIW
jgi:hypothetical protein